MSHKKREDNNMKTQDLIIVGAVVMILSFPLMWLVMLLATGNARLVFENDLARMIEVSNVARQQRGDARRDSLIVEQAYSFHANMQSIEELAAERERMAREQERMQFLIEELEAQRKQITAERERVSNERSRFETAIENQIERQNSGAARRVADLARIYQAMRPAEAAQIMETLSEDLRVDILLAMTDDRQRSRIISAMDTDNASSLTELMAVRAGAQGRR